MIEFPSLKPIESTTLGPESALFAAELAERISLALRAIATGMHAGNVGLDEAVQELDPLWVEARDLYVSIATLWRDGRNQLTTDPGWAKPRARLLSCVDRWPECSPGEYNPACCRFPKSCSCDVNRGNWPVDLLEPVTP